MNETNALTNAPELTVSELSGSLKRAIEEQFGHVRLRGEISNYRGPHSSGHCYFSIKDSSARIDAVIWKGSFLRLKTKPQEGLEVVATGRITTFPGKSSYQIVVEQIEPAGVGALMALLEERRKKLAAEGLFDEARKRKIPFLPQVIGVVTSPTGAVIRDILHRLNDRFPRHVLVWPVRVQGETSASEVAAAIRGFNALDPNGKIPRPNVLIVARGGGSLEDLWSFNEEEVLRAAAESQIPLISAIGHETDWTLLDLVADLRAPTPTGAAEKTVPVRAELLADLSAVSGRLRAAIFRDLERRRADFRGLARALPAPENFLGTPRQNLDRFGDKLRANLAAGFSSRRLSLAEASRLLARHAPHAELQRALGRRDTLAFRLKNLRASLIDSKRQNFEVLAARLAAAQKNQIFFARADLAAKGERLNSLTERLAPAFWSGQQRRREKLEQAEKLLGAVGYQAVLARGFALVRDSEGAPLRSASAIAAGSALRLQFCDGEVAATAGETNPEPVEPARKKRVGVKKTTPKDQGSLF